MYFDLKFFILNLQESDISNEITPSINSTEMDPPFYKDEWMQEATKLGNSKSCGKYGINSKLLKYAPEETHVQIVNMLNNIACTGEYTKKKTEFGILIPLAKPPRKDSSLIHY